MRKRSAVVAPRSTSRLRDRRVPHAARGLRHEAQRHHRGAGEVVARLLVGDVDELLEAPLRGQRREGALHVDARVARADRQRIRYRRRQARLEGPVDEQAPDLLVGHAADELLDVDAAVAQRAALPVGLGDLGGEGDDALQAGLDFGHVGAHVASTGSGSGMSRARSTRAVMRSSSSPSSGRRTAKAASGASASRRQRADDGQQGRVARGDAPHGGDAQPLAVRATAGDDPHERPDDLQHAEGGRRGRRADVARVVQEEHDEAEQARGHPAALRERSRWRRALASLPHSAIEHQRRRPAGERS